MKANHREAYELACMKKDESNLALAYLELSHFAAKYVRAVSMYSETPFDREIDKLYKNQADLLETEADLCEIFKELAK